VTYVRRNIHLRKQNVPKKAVNLGLKVINIAENTFVKPFTMKKRRKVLYIVMWKEDVLIYEKKVIVGVVSVGTLEMRKTLLKGKSVLKCIILSNKTPI
jgi:hypothetical protein